MRKGLLMLQPLFVLLNSPVILSDYLSSWGSLSSWAKRRI